MKIDVELYLPVPFSIKISFLLDQPAKVRITADPEKDGIDKNIHDLAKKFI